VQNCQKIRNEADICRAGDVLTMVLQRENVMSPGGGINAKSSCGSTRDLSFNPMNNLQASSRYTLSFYKNGEDMGFHLRSLKGPFYMCMNYYFVESKIRLLSDYNFRKKYYQRARQQQMDQLLPRMCLRDSGSSGSGHRRSSSDPYRTNITLRSKYQQL